MLLVSASRLLTVVYLELTNGSEFALFALACACYYYVATLHGLPARFFFCTHSHAFLVLLVFPNLVCIGCVCFLHFCIISVP